MNEHDDTRVDVQSQGPAVGSTANIATGDVPTTATEKRLRYAVELDALIGDTP